MNQRQQLLPQTFSYRSSKMDFSRQVSNQQLLSEMFSMEQFTRYHPWHEISDTLTAWQPLLPSVESGHAAAAIARETIQLLNASWRPPITREEQKINMHARSLNLAGACRVAILAAKQSCLSTYSVPIKGGKEAINGCSPRVFAWQRPRSIPQAT